MFRGTLSPSTSHSPPIFDIPDFPILRRVKPLPKRRRTTATSDDDDQITGAHARGVTFKVSAFTSAAAAMGLTARKGLLHEHQQKEQLHIPQPIATFQNLQLPLANLIPTAGEPPDAASTRLALQNYYLPILGGVQSFLNGAAAAAAAADRGSNSNINATINNGNSNRTNHNSNNHNKNSNNPSSTVPATLMNLSAGDGIETCDHCPPLPNSPASLLSQFQLPPFPLSDLDSIGVRVAAAAAAAAAATGVSMDGLNFNVNVGGMNNLGGVSEGVGVSIEGLGVNLGKPAGRASAATSRTGPNVPLSTQSHGLSRGREDDTHTNGNATSRSGGGRDDGDYFDHLRQRGGNTKKRKVPATNAGGGPARAVGVGHIGSDDTADAYMDDDGDLGCLARFGGRDDERERDHHDHRERDRSYSRTLPLHYNTNSYPHMSSPGYLAYLKQKRGKLTAVAVAGVLHKETLEARKRQLKSVMGAWTTNFDKGNSFKSLALDQALELSWYKYPGLGGGFGVGDQGGRNKDTFTPLRVRKSKRMTVRLARAMTIMLEMPERKNRHPDAIPFPVSDFSFEYPSETAKRLVAIKEEVGMLRKRFEVELERQAAKSAKMAAAASGGHSSSKSSAKGRTKRERQERDRERQQRVVEKTANANGAVQGAGKKLKEDQTLLNASSATTDPETANPGGLSQAGDGIGTGASQSPSQGSPIPPSTGKTKKKKRSALANASNPHHLRNYVPSRLPHTDAIGSGGGNNGAGAGAGGGGGHHAQNANANANAIWPLPIRFLSAEIPPRRRRGGKKSSVPGLGGDAVPTGTSPTQANQTNGGAPVIQLTHPSEEWICAFCEYDLFYSSTPGFGEGEAGFGYKRAVRNRKNILKRRRKARERAAGVASGIASSLHGSSKGPPPPPPSPVDDLDLYEDLVGGGGGKWKVAPDKLKDQMGPGLAVG